MHVIPVRQVPSLYNSILEVFEEILYCVYYYFLIFKPFEKLDLPFSKIQTQMAWKGDLVRTVSLMTPFLSSDDLDACNSMQIMPSFIVSPRVMKTALCCRKK